MSRQFLFMLFCAYAVTLSDQLSICCENGVLQLESYECLDAANISTPLKMSCDKKDYIIDDVDFYINETVKIESDDRYCVANETEKYNLTLVLCQMEEPLVEPYVMGICMLISAAFLVPTILVYGLLPEMRDLQGRSITNFCINLALALLVLGNMTIQEQLESFTSCAIQAFLSYFFFLATFFWMNAISIQILLNMSRPITSDRGWRRFLFYALYAYGTPALLTIITVVINYYPGDHRKPHIGLTTCWFIDKTAQWIYMYSFMAIILVINFSIFGYISYILWNNKFSSNHTVALKYKFRMTIRLAIIMGLPWIFEMISTLTPKHIIWVITDFYNVLQGFLIFLVLVVFRRRVVKALHSRGYLDCVGGLVEKWLAVGDDEEGVVEHTTAEGIQM